MCMIIRLKRFLAMGLQRTDITSPKSGYFDLLQLQFACSEMVIATLIIHKGEHNLYVTTSDSFHTFSLKEAYDTAFRDGYYNIPLPVIPVCHYHNISEG